MIRLTLPFPPSVNVMYRRGKFSTYLSKQGREYKTTVADIVSELSLAKLIGRIEVFISLSSPTKRQYDIDNRVKAVLDSIEGWAFIDDNQIDKLTVVRHEPSKGGYCKVVLMEIEKEKPAEAG